MKNIKQIRESYDFITEKSQREQRNLDALVEAGLFEERKLPVLKKILESSADKMSGSEKRFIVNLLESLIVQFSNDQLSEAKKDYLSKYDPRGPKNWPSDSDLPPVLILKRKAIRVYPDNTKVALYYAQSIDRYVSVPYGGDHIMAVNEAKTPVPPDIGKKKNITDADLPEIRKHLIMKTLTSTNPLADAIMNLGIYSGIKSRLRKAAKAKANQPAKPPKPTPVQTPVVTQNAGAPRGQPGWKPRIVKESFENHLSFLREQSATATMPTGIDWGEVGSKAKKFAKKYGPKALKFAKRTAPFIAGGIPKIGIGALTKANPWIAAAQMALSPTAANAPEVEWLKTKEKRVGTAQDRARADAAAAAATKAANQRTFDALKDATKQQGAADTWSDTYSQTKAAKETQQRLARAKAETSSRALAFPGAETLGLGTDIKPIRIPSRGQDVAGYKDADVAAGAKGRSITNTDIFKAAQAKGGVPAIAIPSGIGVDVPPNEMEKAIADAEKRARARAKEAAAGGQAQVQTGDIAAAQAGDKTRVKDKAEEKADAKAQSQAKARNAAQTIARVRSRAKPRLSRGRKFRLPDISLGASTKDRPKEPGPNYQFGLKPSISTPTPVTNRATIDRQMDILNRRANQAMLRENTSRNENDEEVGSATTTQDTKGNTKPVYNFRKRPRVGVNKATSTDAAVQRWLERIGRQANQAMLRQQDQQESVYHAIQNMVENDITEKEIVIGEQAITINNTVAKKIVSLHESMNKKNKKKMEEMLNENATSFNKVLTFAVRH